ncbi:hypothetical protein AAFC00_001043 [Neodothiora populina]
MVEDIGSDTTGDTAVGESGSGGNESTSASGNNQAGAKTSTEKKTTYKASRASSAASPDETEIARLREAVNARMSANSQQLRARVGSQNVVSSPSNNPGRRPSPIKEEPVMSPLTAAFTSPLATTQSTSTESTTSSSKTVRGGNINENTPDAMPLRTPSYPFPYVPGTPRAWSSTFHQPFTALSPTVSARESYDNLTPGAGPSGASTPIATNTAFAPADYREYQAPEDPRYPTPNLYDLVLKLNSEPGLDDWWSTVVKIMHESFKADRATLALPADLNDIENVPWGQKTTFNVHGRNDPGELEVPRSNPNLSVPPRSVPEDQQRSPTMLSSRARPTMVTRHSYAGHTSPTLEGASTESPARGVGAVRPSMLMRTASHAPHLTNAPRAEAPYMDRPTISIRHTSNSEVDFSSLGEDVQYPQSIAVFPTLKGLDHEVDGLIDTSGVNRVLKRGKLVTLTRDYAGDSGDSSSSSRDSQSAGSIDSVQRTKAANPPEPRNPLGRSYSSKLGNFRSVFGAIDEHGRRGSNYEEYEQYPPSPWAQSPAPSPAVQEDPENNPFFTEANVEDSFNPTESPHDYSHLQPVAAIGVDRAHTVIHIPLIHPSLSLPMGAKVQSPDEITQSLKGGRPPDSEVQSSQYSAARERRAPIAILSILSPAVPYPHNLVQSLKLLGPHLATSYSMAHQYTSTHIHAMGLRHRRGASGHTVGYAPLSLEPSNLDELIRADLDDVTESISGSMTSPSDYSGRSRHSPTGSIAGTPGWDPGAFGLSTSRSVAGTPAYLGAEMIDSYFDAKKRTNVHRSSSNAAATQPPVQPSSAKENKTAAKRASFGGADDELLMLRKERRLKSGSNPHKGDKSPLRLSQEHNVGGADSPSRAVPSRSLSKTQTQTQAQTQTQTQTQTQAETTPEAPDNKHSLLHSYGADFTSSFQGLPAATTPKVANSGQTHGRSSSISEEMPPPSERLLRTIIDSLPVQVYTAAPGSGNITWVNAKFLVYRGHDSRQVLRDPWQAIHPDDKGKFMDLWNKSLKTGQHLQMKARLQRFDGNYRWFYVRAAPLKDKKQKIVHWIGTNMDFHEQHLAELNSSRQQETAASEAKYRALANSSPQVVFTVNKTKGITFCNSHWLNYSGQPEAQALGLGFMEYVHPEDIVKCRLPNFVDGSQPTNVPTSVPAEPVRTFSSSAQSSSGSSDTERGPTSPIHTSPVAQSQRKLSELASTGILKVSRDADGRPSYSTEVRLRSKDGEYRWHLVRVVLEDQESQTIGDEDTWYGTCTDINDHKTLERDLKETMDEKSRFLSNMSHEIRTPLNGITGMVNFLIDSSLTAEQMEHVNIIRASTEGLRGLINDILDLSKAEAGMIQLNIDWLHVRSLIEEVNDLTSAMAIDKGLELNYLVDDDVPSQIKGDRFRIRQILLNIIGNAIKFTQTGEVFVRCRVKEDEDHVSTKHEMYLQFEVIDTGRGFTDKEAQYLFKRFSQIDGSSTRQHGGTGLGLVISRQLTQLHGGDMTASGVPGKGSTFTFYIKTSLPSSDDQPPPPPTPGPSLMPSSPSVSGHELSLVPSIKQIPTLSNTRFMSAKSKTSPLLDPQSAGSSYVSSPDALASSGSSDPSIHTARTSSLRSERSSASSYVQDTGTGLSSPITLAMPDDFRHSRNAGADEAEPEGADIPAAAIRMMSPGGSLLPPMYSILVVCPLKYSREATIHHLDMTLPKTIPHQITARASVVECQKMMGGDDPMIFSHVVLVLQSVPEIVAFMDQILSTPSHSSTQLILITDLAQRRSLMEQDGGKSYEELAKEQRLRFIFKPLKPSKFAVIFDPRKEREMSTDRNQDSAQQVAVSQKQVFEEMTRRLRDKGKRVLLVEDNRVNQMVLLKFLSKANLQVETVLDGVQCTEKVFSKPHGYYSIILCDLHMPNKDGYETCREIRKWEKTNNYQYRPIVALSANVLGDVYAKCADAGFNSYVTKPVDFKELSLVMLAFLDPKDPLRPIEFMKPKKLEGTVHKKVS